MTIKEFIKSQIRFRLGRRANVIEIYLGGFLLGGTTVPEFDDVINEVVNEFSPLIAAHRRSVLKEAADVCREMAARYDSDIEGCSENELHRHEEGILCSERLEGIFLADELQRFTFASEPIPHEQTLVGRLEHRIHQLQTELLYEKRTGNCSLEDYKLVTRHLYKTKCPTCGEVKHCMKPFCNACYEKLKIKNPKTWRKIYQMLRRPFVREYSKLIREHEANKNANPAQEAAA